MVKPILTKDDIAKIIAIDDLGKGDRAGAYVRLWQLTGSSEALMQARISSFSGGVGGSAFGANLELQKELGSKYPGLFDLSDKVFQSSLTDVEGNLDQINIKADIINKTVFSGAEIAWNRAGLANDFPGNLFAINPLSSNSSIKTFLTPGTRVALDGANQADFFGKSLNDFLGKPGYSLHVVQDYQGKRLVTVKEDQTGRTVYVGDGGDLLQKETDRLLIDDGSHSHRNTLGRLNLAHRQALQKLRQHEMPGEIDISKTGVIKLLDLAKTQAMQAKRKKSAFQQMHQRLLQRAQARFAVAPLRTRLGVAVPVRRQAVSEAEAATGALRAGVSPGAAAPLGQVPGRLSLHPVLGTKMKTGAIPWPIAPRGAAAQIAAGLAKRGILHAPGSLGATPDGEMVENSMSARAATAGQAVLSPPPAFSREARRGAMRNAVTLPDGNAVLAPGNYAPDTAAAYMPLHEYEASAQAALDSDWRENFERLMHRESRRPPSGTTGVDWRVAVPWPGLKTL